MKKNLQKRLARIEAHYASAPIPPHVIAEAFEHFRSTGELPEELALGYLVVRRAQAGYDYVYDQSGNVDLAASIRVAIEAKPRPADPTMDELLMEAVLGAGLVRAAARESLQMFAELGLDPSEPLFAGLDVKLPDWGGVGIHFAGLPDMLAQAPYEEQAKRLLARYEVLRDRVPQGNRLWFDRLARAISDFQDRGRLPDDELIRDCVLADGEIRLLLRHHAGEDMSEGMAAFDELARAEGETRDEALLRVLAITTRRQPTSAAAQ